MRALPSYPMRHKRALAHALGLAGRGVGCGRVVANRTDELHMKKNLEAKLEKGPYASNDVFRRIASRTSHGVGSPWAFIGAVVVILVWGMTGPLFHYSDTWQLVINTGTTIITFLMVFLIQNTQNRDSHALHLKLDELIRSNDLARNRLMGLEDLTDGELDELQAEFDHLAKEKLAARASKPPSGSRPRHQAGGSKSSASTTGARSSRAT
jgi:low affinity Fe/Cu permease